MLYELTITLRPTMYRFTPREQYDKTEGLLQGIFHPLRNQRFFATVIAELTHEQNVHYHCIIQLDTIEEKTLLMNRFRKLHTVFGKKSISPVQWEQSYRNYMVKDFRVTEKVLGISPVVIDDFLINPILFKEKDETPDEYKYPPIPINISDDEVDN